MSEILSHLSEKHNWLFRPPPPLPGRVEYMGRGDARYGVYVKDYFFNKGKVNYNKVYLGKVVNEAKCLFYKKKLGGYFTFSLEKGFARLDDPDHAYALKAEPEVSLEFGDAWLCDQLLRRLGLDKVIASVFPEAEDAIKTLVAFRLLNNSDFFLDAEKWRESSYARILYPQARLDPHRISEIHARLGREENYVKFLTSYLEIITKNTSVYGKTSAPILIDSARRVNSVNPRSSPYDKPQREISREMRLIYIVDKDTKLPIYLIIISENILDDKNLITILNTLDCHGVKVESINRRRLSP
ncbi:MAG: hypothetical protein LBR53_04985 [Deltaproteobacteria bacterium]|nr:hypothetical protein [Deltaproteobacteria bacterium]